MSSSARCVLRIACMCIFILRYPASKKKGGGGAGSKILSFLANRHNLRSPVEIFLLKDSPPLLVTILWKQRNAIMQDNTKRSINGPETQKPVRNTVITKEKLQHFPQKRSSWVQPLKNWCKPTQLTTSVRINICSLIYSPACFSKKTCRNFPSGKTTSLASLTETSSGSHQLLEGDMRLTGVDLLMSNKKQVLLQI